MCNLSEVVEEKGRREGQLLLLKNLIKNMKMPVEQAFATLEIPERDRQEYCRLLAK